VELERRPWAGERYMVSILCCPIWHVGMRHHILIRAPYYDSPTQRFNFVLCNLQADFREDGGNKSHYRSNINPVVMSCHSFDVARPPFGRHRPAKPIIWAQRGTSNANGIAKYGRKAATASFIPGLSENTNALSLRCLCFVNPLPLPKLRIM